MLVENGKHVLVVEREIEFKNRIRGEAIGPWGVLELQKLGLYERLSEKCAHNQPYVNTIGMGQCAIYALQRRNVCPPSRSTIRQCKKSRLTPHAQRALKSGAAAPRARFAPAHRRQFPLSAAVWFAI
jgi:hypothetical protein